MPGSPPSRGSQLRPVSWASLTLVASGHEPLWIRRGPSALAGAAQVRSVGQQRGHTASIRPYRAGDLDAATDVLARAFAGNPLHLALFSGDDTDRFRQRKLLFATSLQFLNLGERVVLEEEGRVVGFAHWISHPGCRPSPDAMEKAGPRLAEGLDGDALSRVITWRRAWGERDPDQPHSHFGPLAVHPDEQGKGLGRRLLEHYCDVVDGSRETSYLETERPENLPLYRKAGFEVTAESEVLGVQSWFMTRLPS